jgi:hypothetical protein
VPLGKDLDRKVLDVAGMSNAWRKGEWYTIVFSEPGSWFFVLFHGWWLCWYNLYFFLLRMRVTGMYAVWLDTVVLGEGDEEVFCMCTQWLYIPYTCILLKKLYLWVEIVTTSCAVTRDYPRDRVYGWTCTL